MRTRRRGPERGGHGSETQTRARGRSVGYSRLPSWARLRGHRWYLGSSSLSSRRLLRVGLSPVRSKKRPRDKEVETLPVPSVKGTFSFNPQSVFPHEIRYFTTLVDSFVWDGDTRTFPLHPPTLTPLPSHPTVLPQDRILPSQTPSPQRLGFSTLASPCRCRKWGIHPGFQGWDFV